MCERLSGIASAELKTNIFLRPISKAVRQQQMQQQHLPSEEGRTCTDRPEVEHSRYKLLIVHFKIEYLQSPETYVTFSKTNTRLLHLWSPPNLYRIIS